MFTAIGSVHIFVENQDRAKDFYVNTLGMELRSDQPMYPGADVRWLSVAPPGAKTELVLMKMDENSQHYKSAMGKSQALTMEVSNIAALCDRLKAKGVEFTQELAVDPWGTWTIFRDADGNGVMIVERTPT